MATKEAAPKTEEAMPRAEIKPHIEVPKMPSISQSSIADKVPQPPSALNIPELLESILLYLDEQTLLVTVQRVSKHWRDLIATSPRLQRKLFLLPDDSAAAARDPRPNPLLAAAFPLLLRRHPLAAPAQPTTSPPPDRLGQVGPARGLAADHGPAQRRREPPLPAPAVAAPLDRAARLRPPARQLAPHARAPAARARLRGAHADVARAPAAVAAAVAPRRLAAGAADAGSAHGRVSGVPGGD
ncbi:hypothetical protein PG997_000982 [Apiospora hydei]|uniref:F-box domain-containing protein n=1 Tax=Apiospora hydei TaxID=1337664 RepID=A0ABR1XCF2_9PEZI